MKKSTLIFLSVAYFFIACSSKPKPEHEVKTFDKFPTIIELSHERIQTEPVLYFVGGLLLLDNVLITVDLKADPFFRVFKLPSLEYKGGFITRGSGPDEEIFINPFISRVSENKFLYQGVTSVKTMKYEEQTGKMKAVGFINLPIDLMSIQIQNIIKIGDTIIGNRLEGQTNKEFIGYNIESDEIFDFGIEFPLMDRKIPVDLKDVLFAKVSVVKPDGSAFATVYDKFPILRIYTNTGKIRKETRLNNGQRFPYGLIKNNPTRYDIDNVMQNYRAIKTSNNFIYALYIGKASQELDRGLNDFSNEIHVWNWDGEPVKKILLDKKIFTFDVDLNDTYLIASSLLSLDALYKYDLRKTP